MKREKILRYLEKTTNYMATTKVTYLCAVIDGVSYCEFNSPEPVNLGDALYALNLKDSDADITSFLLSENACEAPTKIFISESVD